MTENLSDSKLEEAELVVELQQLHIQLFDRSIDILLFVYTPFSPMMNNSLEDDVNAEIFLQEGQRHKNKHRP